MENQNVLKLLSVEKQKQVLERLTPETIARWIESESNGDRPSSQSIELRRDERRRREAVAVAPIQIVEVPAPKSVVLDKNADAELNRKRRNTAAELIAEHVGSQREPIFFEKIKTVADMVIAEFGGKTLEEFEKFVAELPKSVRELKIKYHLEVPTPLPTKQEVTPAVSEPANQEEAPAEPAPAPTVVAPAPTPRTEKRQERKPDPNFEATKSALVKKFGVFQGAGRLAGAMIRKCRAEKDTKPEEVAELGITSAVAEFGQTLAEIAKGLGVEVGEAKPKPERKPRTEQRQPKILAELFNVLGERNGLGDLASALDRNTNPALNAREAVAAFKVLVETEINKDILAVAASMGVKLSEVIVHPTSVQQHRREPVDPLYEAVKEKFTVAIRTDENAKTHSIPRWLVPAIVMDAVENSVEPITSIDAFEPSIEGFKALLSKYFTFEVEYKDAMGLTHKHVRKPRPAREDDGGHNVRARKATDKSKGGYRKSSVGEGLTYGDGGPVHIKAAIRQARRDAGKTVGFGHDLAVQSLHYLEGLQHVHTKR